MINSADSCLNGEQSAFDRGQVAEWFKALDSKLQTDYFLGFPPVTIALQVCHNERVRTSNAFLGFP
jgi:hypothetical protein